MCHTILLSWKKNLCLKSYLSGSKVGIRAFIRAGLCAGRGLYVEQYKRYKYVALSVGAKCEFTRGEIRYEMMQNTHNVKILCLGSILWRKAIYNHDYAKYRRDNKSVV